MKYRLFDSHCHLNSADFDKDRELLLTLAKRIGVRGMLIPGTTRESWRRIRQLTGLYAGVYTALGLHPLFLEHHKRSDIRSLERAVGTPPIKAVGEIGLDFYMRELDRQKQINLFHAQLQIANTAKLPVLLHVRKAHEDVLKHLRMVNFQWGGFCHAFSGSMDQARRYMDMGFKLGFGGAVTYPRAAKLRSMAVELPLTSIVLETDAPDMKPITCQTARNTPVHLLDNYRALCEIRSELPSVIAEQTTQNACDVLDIDADAL